MDDIFPCRRIFIPANINSMRINTAMYLTDQRPRGNNKMIGNWITTIIQKVINLTAAPNVLKKFCFLTRVIVHRPRHFPWNHQYILHRRHLRVTEIQQTHAQP